MGRLAVAIILASLATATLHDGRPRAADEPLPFDMPSPEVLRSSDRKVYAHYIPVFPISIDNRPEAEDYYTTQFLAPEGEGGTHTAYGGFLRARPLPRPVDPAPDWALRDMRTEVERARRHGFDGFIVDVFGLEGSYWDRVLLLLDAARDVDPSFDIVLAPGANTGVVDDPELLADAMAELADHPAAARDEIGRLVIAPFLAEAVAADYWRNWIGSMADRGVEVAFAPILLDYALSIDDFSDFSVRAAAWGPRSTAGIDDLRSYGEDAAARDIAWVQPVAMQDSRPKEGVFDEPDNTETLRAMWATADEVDASWVDVVSWNDYSESTQFAPSTGIGWSLLDLNTYYLVAYKTGTAPPIVRDRVYVSHRIHSVDTDPTGGQSQLMELRAGSSPANDEVEVLTFLRHGATVDVTVGASNYTYDAPPGVHAERFALEPGVITASTRAADGSTTSVASPYEVTTEPVVQDLEYRLVGSGRDGQSVDRAPGTATIPESVSPDETVAVVSPSAPASDLDQRDDGSEPASSPPPSSSGTSGGGAGGGGASWVAVGAAGAAVIAVLAFAVVRRWNRSRSDVDRLASQPR